MKHNWKNNNIGRRDIVIITVIPSDVDDNGIARLDDDRFIRMEKTNLTPPEGGKPVPVLMMFNSMMMAENERIDSCPSCSNPLPLTRPIFLMEDGAFVYPCLDCEWVWCDIDQSLGNEFV